jgi:acetyltransferase-like isoleucine patch superfamily enzyme
MNRYSISETIKTAYSLAVTKLTMNQARLIRRPIYIRGRKSLVGARGLTTGYSCRFDLAGDKETLFIGQNCEFGDMTHIVAYERVEIGNNVLIASKCFISDTSHGNYKGESQSNPDLPPNKRELVTKPTKIGNNVWIGENAVILAGAEIGDGCVIGANSVVTKQIPQNSIAVGSPAKVVRKYEYIDKLWSLQR